VTYPPSFPPTRLSPNGRERASGSLATQFIGWVYPWPPCALFILRVMTHRRVLKRIADIPKAVRLVIPKIFCSYVKSWLATALIKQVYHKYCTMAQFIIRLPTALFHKSFAPGGIFISLRILPNAHPIG
jgi:hypothetical protein